MNLDRHTRRNTLFRTKRKSNRIIKTNNYIEEYINDVPLDIDNIKEIECPKCSTIYNTDNDKKCPYCQELDKYYSTDPNDFMSYVEKNKRSGSLWKTAYEKPTLKYLIGECWYSPFKLNLKDKQHSYHLDKLSREKYESSRVYLNSEMINYGDFYEWFKEEVIYDDEEYEKLENNKKIISEFQESRMNLHQNGSAEENDSDEEYYSNEENLSQYLYKHYKDKFYHKKIIPFRKVLCIGYNCDICYDKSTYNINDTTHFNVFLTSRNENSILECYDYCYCAGTRVKNYDYCQKCFFSLPLQKSLRNLLLVKLFYKHQIYEDGFIFYCSNLIKD